MTRSLSNFRLFVCVPLGVLWLGVIAVIAVPVIIYMTLLYYLWTAVRTIVGGRRAARGPARDEA